MKNDVKEPEATSEEKSRLFPILPMGGDVKRGPVRGRKGETLMLPIESLRVDATFQRAISAGSARNIERICREFDWAKFLPVIVVRDEDPGMSTDEAVYSVVDGQHRTTAAATLGVTEVPCYVLECSREDAAAAFAAINGNVTAVSPVDIWFAELIANTPEAVTLNKVLEAADVRVTRKKDGHLPGETRAINVLKRARKIYGDAVLTTSLQCITQTGNGNPGMISGAVVNGVAKAIVTKPELLNDPSKLFDIFDQVDLTEILEAAKTEVARTGNIVQAVITREVNAVINRYQKEAA